MQDPRKQKRAAQMKLIDAGRVRVRMGRIRTEDQTKANAAKRKKTALLSIPSLMSHKNSAQAQRCKVWRQRPAIAARVKARQNQAAANRRRANPLEGFQHDQKIDRAIELLWTNTGQDEKPLFARLRALAAPDERHRDKRVYNPSGGNPKEEQVDDEFATPIFNPSGGAEDQHHRDERASIPSRGGGLTEDDTEFTTLRVFNPSGGGNHEFATPMFNPSGGGFHKMYQCAAEDQRHRDSRCFITGQDDKPLFDELRTCPSPDEHHRDKRVSNPSGGNPKDEQVDDEFATPTINPIGGAEDQRHRDKRVFIPNGGGGLTEDDTEFTTQRVFNPSGGGGGFDKMYQCAAEMNRYSFPMEEGVSKKTMLNLLHCGYFLFLMMRTHGIHIVPC